MAVLIANVSSGKGTLGHVARVIAEQEWEKIFLITNKFGKENFKPEKNAEMIVLDEMKTISELQADIISALKGKIPGFEVAVNVVSGTGKEHMAIMSALLKLGLGIRFIALTRDGVKEI